MRVIFIATVALLVGCGLLIGNESWASQGTYPGQRFVISKQGTLLELIDADGRGRTKKVTGDGFKLNYETRCKKRSASAIETKTKGLRTSSEPAKYDGNKATAVVQTADESLEITSELIFDANTGELIINRKFRNISKYPVTLESVRNYIDPKVMVRGPFNQYADLLSLAQGQIRAGYYFGNPPDDCGDRCECTTPPICNDCPPRETPNLCRGVWRSRLYPSNTKVELGLDEPITLQPNLPEQPESEFHIAIRILMR